MTAGAGLVVAPPAAVAACIAPSIAASPPAAPRGAVVTISGRWFSTTCNDTHSGSAGCSPPWPSSLPQRGIGLALVQPDWQRGLVTVDGFEFATEVRVPLDAPTGEGSFESRIRTEALLNADVGVLERPWEVPTNPTIVSPTAVELAFAAHALRQVEELCGASTSYARVDVVSRSPDDVVLMEVELIDPSLSLWANSDAATQLAATVVALLA